MAGAAGRGHDEQRGLARARLIQRSRLDRRRAVTRLSVRSDACRADWHLGVNPILAGADRPSIRYGSARTLVESPVRGHKQSLGPIEVFHLLDKAIAGGIIWYTSLVQEQQHHDDKALIINTFYNIGSPPLSSTKACLIRRR